MAEDSNTLLDNFAEDLSTLDKSLDSPIKPVKSTAIVKYSAAPNPATFAQLRCNTDLNNPPSNWLSTSAESYGLQSVWSRNHGFTSFRMADMFPDCVGEVDVVSGAENIKKLLKIPYSTETISMMVHRVENTLLLDDFDIHKYLLRQSEDDWKWLKEFFYEHVFHRLGNKEKQLFPKANSRSSIQQKSLISKFLYHSLVLHDDKKHNTEKPSLPAKPVQDTLPEPKQDEKLPDPNYKHNFARNVVWTFENIQMLIGTDMPIFGGQTHPCISLKLHDSNKPINVLTGIDYWLDNLMCNVPELVMCYHLDGIVQKYELIKTEDLPNLNNAKFSPKVIKDIAQNILSFLKNNATKAGHTYWLFKGKNDDVVKLYDLTSLCSDMLEDKTQNPFTVPVAMLLYRVARNMKYSEDYKKNRSTIRTLLKNCIQLLPREKYPQIVTSAHYMLADLYIPADTNPTNPNLPEDDEEDTKSECGSNAESEKNDEKLEEDMNAAIKSFRLNRSKTFVEDHPYKEQDFEEFKFIKHPPITGSVEERCQLALEHVLNGLECLKYFPIDSENKNNTTENGADLQPEKSKHEYDEALENMAKPFQVIPMGYAPLNSETSDEAATTNSPATGTTTNCPKIKKKSKQKKKKMEKSDVKTNCNSEQDTSAKALLCKPESKTLPTWQAPRKDDNRSWAIHLKTLLYEKASLAFVVLAEHEYTKKNYGTSLRYVLAVLRCQKMIQLSQGTLNDKLINYLLLGRAGDCFFMVVQDWANVDKHRNDFETKSVTENAITDAIFAVENFDISDIETVPEGFETLEATLVASYKCYEKALLLKPAKEDKENLLRRLGNIHNELGVFYMNQASIQTRSETDTSDVTSLLTSSRTHLESGIKAFENVHDEANLALLHSNTGRLMRLCAHINTSKNSPSRLFYNKAVASYQKALQVLGSRETHSEIWDNVTWELCSTLFNLAAMLQDYPMVDNGSEEDLEREVVEIFQKALKYCETETPGSRQLVYQFRAASIQHRLASLYHKVYRESNLEVDCVRRKNILQLSKNYYEKAAKILHALEQTKEFLTVQMERVALSEFQAQISSSTIAKMKAHQYCIELILQCKPIIEIIIDRNKNITDSDENESNEDEVDDQRKTANDKKKETEKSHGKMKILREEDLVKLLEERLQFALLSLTKLSKSKSVGNQKKEDESYVQYKKCYSLSLRSGTLSKMRLAEHIVKILNEIEKVLKETQES